jgi:hypothetical protein
VYDRARDRIRLAETLGHDELLAAWSRGCELLTEQALRVEVHRIVERFVRRKREAARWN